jgi:hypothetical protein
VASATVAVSNRSRSAEPAATVRASCRLLGPKHARDPVVGVAAVGIQLERVFELRHRPGALARLRVVPPAESGENARH